MSDLWDAPKLGKTFPLVLDGRDGAVEVWQHGEWTYQAIWTGAAEGRVQYPLPPELLSANYLAGEWIKEQVRDCPHAKTETHGWQTDTGSGDWEVETCLDCEQPISAGHI